MHPAKPVPAITDKQTIVANLKTGVLRNGDQRLPSDDKQTHCCPSVPASLIASLQQVAEGIYKWLKGVSTRSVSTRYVLPADRGSAREAVSLMSVVTHENGPQSPRSLVSLRLHCVRRFFERIRRQMALSLHVGVVSTEARCKTLRAGRLMGCQSRLVLRGDRSFSFGVFWKQKRISSASLRLAT